MEKTNTKKAGKMKLENVIYCGDNLTWLKKFPDKCIDLIYLDPPFFSNKNYAEKILKAVEYGLQKVT